MGDNRKRFRFQLNIGFIVFIILFIYLTITIIVNLMKENVSVCRVEEGQIVNSASFTGVCIRDEEVVNASGNGYINFYVRGRRQGRQRREYLSAEQQSASEQ